MMTRAVTPICILVVDSSELIRRGVKSVFTTHHQSLLRVVGEAGTAADAVAEAARLKPDIVLLSPLLPDGSGFDVCREILRQQPELRVVVLTSVSTDHSIYEAVASGAQGYLLKDIAPAALVQALIDVSKGKSILDPATTARIMHLVRAQSTGAASKDLAALSPQERRVLALVAKGRTNKEVGKQLGLSDNTVKNYLGSVFEKLQVKNRSQAAAVYVQNTAPQ
jgi:two-component system response regulator DevR